MLASRFMRTGGSLESRASYAGLETEPNGELNLAIRA